MRRAQWIALLSLAPALALAETWSGFLVDSRCFASLEWNANPTDTEGSVDRDRRSEVRYCAPNRKTKIFAVVEEDGETLQLDPAGNARILEFVSKTGKRRFFHVEITGEKAKKTVQVESISAAR